MEDSKDGNAQKADKFWNIVEEKYYIMMEVKLYRPKYQMTTRWEDLNLKMSNFSNIYYKLIVDPKKQG